MMGLLASIRFSINEILCVRRYLLEGLRCRLGDLAKTLRHQEDEFAGDFQDFRDFPLVFLILFFFLFFASI